MTDATSQLLAVVISHWGSIRSVVVSGEVDLATVEELADSIGQGLARSDEELIVDLRDVTFMDCSGAKVILEARRRADEAGDRLIVFPSKAVRRTFEILELERLLADSLGQPRGSAPTS